MNARAFSLRNGDGWSLPALAGLIVVQIWLAHALAFFTHEYAHAVVAWLLGWKGNPLDLDYAKPTPLVVLIQLGINQKVDEAPIFASGHGAQAALIAAAGMVLGNGLITYPLGLWGLRAALRAGRPALAMAAFWLTAASVGNLIDYVPIRVFTPGGDMASVERGFGWLPWLVLVLFGLPALAATVHFFARLVPQTVWALFPVLGGRRLAVALVAIAFVLGFYGIAGLLESDAISRTLSLVTLLAALPLTALAEILALRRPPAANA